MARQKTVKVSPKRVQIEIESDEIVSSLRNPETLVFISHDSRDADLAEAFANLLSDVSAGTLKSFRSSDKKGTSGIEFGTEWYTAIMSQLGDATDVVALLTQRSVDRPWILYEAGVAKGKLDTNVLGIALGVPLDKVSSGPFGQFQNCADDEDSLTKLVLQLIRRNPEAAPREEAVKMQVKVFQEKAKKIISEKDVVVAATPTATDDSNIAKLFEETKIMIRELPSRVEDGVRSVSRRGNSKFSRKFHPMMIDELLHFHGDDDDPKNMAAAWLVVVSLFREDVPWVYEGGIQLYRAILSDKIMEIREAHEQFDRMMKITSHGPFMHELMERGDGDFHFIIRHLPELLGEMMRRLTKQITKRQHIVHARPKGRRLLNENLIPKAD
jgi:TIR domain